LIALARREFVPVFEKRTQISAPAQRVFDWHKLPDALERLAPPGERVRIVARSGQGIEKGARVTLETRFGPFPVHWIAEHADYVEGEWFRDVQVSGPFAKWIHTHRVEPDGPDTCYLVDHVEYELPLGVMGRLFGGWFARRKLARLFDYRHRVTAREVEGA
jgi:hypothetical protein